MNGSDIMYSLEDLQLGAEGDLRKLSEGRRLKVILGGQGDSRFSYRAVLLDARQQSDPYVYHCGVLIVPKVRLTLSTWLVHCMDDIHCACTQMQRKLFFD